MSPHPFRGEYVTDREFRSKAVRALRELLDRQKAVEARVEVLEGGSPDPNGPDPQPDDLEPGLWEELFGRDG